MRPLVCIALLVGSIAGCDNPILNAVIDKETDPGGTLSVQIDDAAPGMLPALAQGSPLAITAQDASLVVAFTCQADANGRTAAMALANAGGSSTLPILPMNGNQLQVHTGGQSYVADAGTISLVTNADGTISGTFDTTGHVMASGDAATLKGSLSEIPQAH